MKKERLKNHYLQGLGLLVIVLALVRCIFPSVAEVDTPAAGRDAGEPVATAMQEMQTDTVVEEFSDRPIPPPEALPYTAPGSRAMHSATRTMRHLGTGERRHRIYSVSDYQTVFPDTNALQLSAACHWGVTPVRNRADAEERRTQLVYIGASPYYSVDRLTRSIPYLVPRAAVLLDDIGRAFFDSLHVKGMALHRLIVTSVLRSEEDVEKLRRTNKNATELSCHLYGTTFDISYTRFHVVEDPQGPPRRVSPNDSLKWVLSEVLRDMREGERCFIKHEVKQPCFHITVR